MKTMRLLCCFLIGLTSLSTPVWPSAFAQSAKEQSVEKINIPELLREAETKSCQIRREQAPQYKNYTYKARRVIREKERGEKIKEESEVREIYAHPSGHPYRGGRGESVLIEKNGTPVASGKIEKERLKAGKNLERHDREPLRPYQDRRRHLGAALPSSQRAEVSRFAALAHARFSL